MGSRVCYVPFCRSKRRKTKKVPGVEEEGVTAPGKLVLFSAPKDPARRAAWDKAIRRKDKKLGPNDSVCSLHFEEGDIIKGERFVIRGEEVLLPRQRWKLKEDAVPRIFPGYPAHMLKSTKTRKPPKDRSLVQTQPKQTSWKGNNDNDGHVETIYVQVTPDINSAPASPSHQSTSQQSNKPDDTWKGKGFDDEDAVVVETVYVDLRNPRPSGEANKPVSDIRSVPLPSSAWTWVCIPDEEDVARAPKLFCFETLCHGGRLEIRKSLQVVNCRPTGVGDIGGSVVYSLFGVPVQNKSLRLKTDFSDLDQLAGILHTYHRLAKVRKRQAVPDLDPSQDHLTAAKKKPPPPNSEEVVN